MIVYKITNKINGKAYIGQTVNTLQSRWKMHCRPNGCTLFYRAIKKYGPDSFDLTVLKECDDLHSLNDTEAYFINYYNSLYPNGYNLRTGGSNSLINAETKKKMSLASKGKPKSLEHKTKMYKIPKGYKFSATARQNMSASRTGLSKKGRQIICNETGEHFISVSAASSKTGIYRRKIARQLSGETKKTKCSVTFRYANVGGVQLAR